MFGKVHEEIVLNGWDVEDKKLNLIKNEKKENKKWVNRLKEECE